MRLETAPSSALMTPLSTRLFPKFKGAAAVRLSGVADLCDWVVLTDPRPPHLDIRKKTGTGTPKTIFLSLRHYPAALDVFANQILPELAAPFTLISGSEDVTLPDQTDKRWPEYNEAEAAAISKILASPFLVKWFAENLSRKTHAKLEPLPVGFVLDGEQTDGAVAVPEAVPPLSDRKNLLLCAHMIRAGDQWETRRRVSTIAKREWGDFTTILDKPVDRAAFSELLQSHAFVLCVEGGGLDPSPKAFEAILHGAVPIIRRSCISKAYQSLDCFEIEDWSAPQISRDRLENQKNDLIDLGKDAFREDKLEKLTLDHWWATITAVARSSDDVFGR